MVPSLNLEWNCDDVTRSGPTLIIRPIKGKVAFAKTLKFNSLRNYGTIMYNWLPLEIRLFAGDIKGFKNLLDKHLETVPDLPHCENLVPYNTDREGTPSNSLKDWFRNRSF